MPGADENERVKRLYERELGKLNLKDMLGDLINREKYRGMFVEILPPAEPKPAYDSGLLDNFKPRKPAWPRVKTLVDKAVELFQKTPITTPPKRQPQGTSLLFSYADDSRPIRGLRSDLILLDEVQDMVDDFSLIERPISPIIQDQPKWEDRLLGSFKDMQDSTLYRQEIMGTWPKEDAPIGGRPYFPREDVLRAYQQGLVSQKTLMEQLNIAVEAPEPRVAVPRIVPKEIKSEEFVKSKFELMTYQSDVRTILAEQTASSLIDAEDAAFRATMTRVAKPAPEPVIVPIVNDDYGDAYRVIEAGRLGGRVPRKTSWRTMDSIRLRRTRVKVNLQPELGPGSTQAPKLRAYSAVSESRNEPYVYIPEFVGDRWCPHCREPVKMSQDMDRPNGQRVLCGECWSLKKTDRTAYEARIKRMPPTRTQRIGVPVYQCLPSPNLP